MASISYQIANLLDKMTSSDKDFRFMATNDLMAELQKDSIKLDDDTERKVWFYKIGGLRNFGALLPGETQSTGFQKLILGEGKSFRPGGQKFQNIKTVFF